MENVVVDSGPLIALFDGSDRYHAQAVDFIQNVTGRLVANLPVITEVVFVLDFSHQAQRDFLDWVAKAFHIDANTVADFPRMQILLEKYSDLPADFADVSLVALCERLNTTLVASVDRDSTIYRSHGKRAFANVFFGGE